MLKQLKNTDINAIRRALRTTTQQVVAETFGISRKTVYNIETGKTYRDVPPPKQLKQFPNYEIYSDGVVLSRKTGRELNYRSDRSTASVRLVDRNLSRRRVLISDLLKKAFG